MTRFLALGLTGICLGWGLAACQYLQPPLIQPAQATSTASTHNTQSTPAGPLTLVVAPTGLGEDCTQANPCALSTANQRANASDTIELVAGIYTTAIQPARDGQYEKPITYLSQDGQAVLQNSENCAVLDQRSWIVLKKLSFSDCGGSWITASGVKQITVQECSFNSTRRAGYSGILFRDAEQITLRGNQFGQWGENALVQSSAGFGDAVRIERTDYALVENNDFSAAHAGHSLLSLAGRFSVLRGNLFQNPWQKDVEVVGSITNAQGVLVEAGPYLVENNRFENAVYTVYTRKADGKAETAKGGEGLQTSASGSIFRGNIFANNQLSGLAASVTSQAQGFSDNFIYRNTFYNQPGGAGIRLTSYAAAGRMQDNWLVNNLFVDNGYAENPDANYSYSNPYSSHGRPDPGVQVMFDFANGSQLGINHLIGNLFFQTNSGLANLLAVNGIGHADVRQWQSNPKYAPLIYANQVFNPKLDLAGGQFGLLPGSPAINSGQSLTTAVSAGENSLELPVTETGFFSTGWGLVAADWIQIGSTPPVQIARIDAQQHILILTEPRSWRAEDAVDLYRDSCGFVVLAGALPDPGASEYGSENPAKPLTCGE